MPKDYRFELLDYLMNVDKSHPIDIFELVLKYQNETQKSRCSYFGDFMRPLFDKKFIRYAGDVQTFMCTKSQQQYLSNVIYVTITPEGMDEYARIKKEKEPSKPTTTIQIGQNTGNFFHQSPVNDSFNQLTNLKNTKKQRPP